MPSASAGFRPIRVLSTDDFFPKQTPASPEEHSTSALSDLAIEDRLNSDDQLQSEGTTPEISSPVTVAVTALDPDVIDIGASSSNVLNSPAFIKEVDSIDSSVINKSDVVLIQNDGENLGEKVTESDKEEPNVSVT